MYGTTNARLYTKCHGAVQRMSGSIHNIIYTYISFNLYSNGTAQRMSGSNHLIGNIVWHGTTSVRPIHIIMKIAHSFSFIHRISCRLIAFLCKDRRPAYPLMRQGPVSCALRFIIKDQCPALFLSHSYHQEPMSCSTTSYSLRQPPSFVICDISVSVLQLCRYRHLVTRTCYSIVLIPVRFKIYQTLAALHKMPIH